MMNLQILPERPLIKFDRQLPMFNWHYPFDREEDLLDQRLTPYIAGPRIEVQRRAIYIHIPFCETICNFCPFGREVYRSESDISDYVRALVAELDLKQELIGRCKVDAIFIGGGTPSLLTPKAIATLGEAISRNFNLSGLREFTFEVEVKSVTPEKLQAIRDIGVNRVSFGAQTFSAKYRSLFSLDATVEQIFRAAELLTAMFPYTNVDLLYGLSGQQFEEFQYDLEMAVQLGTTTIDVYPLNNLSASPAMHRASAQAGLDLLPESTRVNFRILSTQYLKELGYKPISGYSFAHTNSATADSSDPVQHEPKFLYHDLVYGYESDEIIGYGSSAISQRPGFNMYNFSKRPSYEREILMSRNLPHLSYGLIFSPERGVVSFPYRGELQKSRIAWSEVPDETLKALQEALDAGLVVDNGNSYALTRAGWVSYVDLMYYLMPTAGKLSISRGIEQKASQGRAHGETSLITLAQQNEDGSEAKLI
jgi:anaerobilin synthase